MDSWIFELPLDYSIFDKFLPGIRFDLNQNQKTVLIPEETA